MGDKRKNNYFVKECYNGSDSSGFQDDFVAYLENTIATTRWDAMSEHSLFLQGAKKAIEEIIQELKRNMEDNG
jgi:hypothetical protein